MTPEPHPVRYADLLCHLAALGLTLRVDFRGGQWRARYRPSGALRALGLPLVSPVGVGPGPEAACAHLAALLEVA